jgi:hypothetical protein
MGERKGRTLAHVLQVKEWWRELRKEGDLT